MRVKGRQWFFITLLMAVLATVYAMGAHAATPAHSVIDNWAQATYAVDGVTRTAYSNWVTLSVAQVADITVFPVSDPGSPSDSGFVFATVQHVVPGQTVVVPYRLTNTGNGPDTVTLTAAAVARGGLPAVPVAVYHDENEDGLPGEPRQPLTNMTLQAGQSAALLLTLTVPAAAPAGSGYYVALQAQSGVDAAVAVTNTWSSLTVTDSEPIVQVSRSVTVDPKPVTPPVWAGSVHAAADGAALRHTITINNVGYAKAQNVTVIEAIDANEQLPLHASEMVIGGTAYAIGTGSDAFVKRTAAADGSQRLQFTWPELAPGQRLVVVYETEAAWSSSTDLIEKTAYAVYTPPLATEQTVASNTIIVSPAGRYGVRLAPPGAAVGPGELGRQGAPRVVAGEHVGFPLVVTNTGTLPATVNLDITPELSGWSTALYMADGFTPLSNDTTRTLLPGETEPIVVGIMPPTAPSELGDAPYVFQVTARVAEAPTVHDVSFIRIDNVQTVTPHWDPLTLMADTTSGVAAGGSLTYALLFGNNSDHPAHDVVIVQPLSPALAPPAAAVGEVGPLAPLLEAIALSPASAFTPPAVPGVTGTYDPVDHAVVWSMPLVPANSGGRLVLQSAIKSDAPGGTVVTMQGRLSAAGMDDDRYTNIVQHVVLGTALHVELSAARPTVAVGDVNTYTVTVRNISTSVAITETEAVVALPPGLTHRGAGGDNGRVVTLPVGTLAAGESRRLTLDAVANAGAAGTLTVTAHARGLLPAATVVESAPVSVHTLVTDGMWGDAGLITGTVKWGDVPLAGVQVVLHNGRYAVSDTGGRFAVTGVGPGRWTLRLEPDSLVAAVAEVGGDVTVVRGGSNRLTVHVLQGGMALANFRLPAEAGAAKATEGDGQ